MSAPTDNTTFAAACFVANTTNVTTLLEHLDTMSRCGVIIGSVNAQAARSAAAVIREMASQTEASLDEWEVSLPTM